MNNTQAAGAEHSAALTDRYLDLLAKTVTRYDLDATLRPISPTQRSRALQGALKFVQGILAKKSFALSRIASVDLSEREIGHDIPVLGESGIGLVRLANVRYCIETVLADDIPGDLIEAGVWRGGTIIFMCGVLAAHDAKRIVWAADSFQGMPAPDVDNFPQDEHIGLHELDEMAVSQSTVRQALARYSLLDENVRFLEGWFKDTLPTAPIEQLSVLRVDADMYESTMQVLEALYGKVSPGGFVIIDDYGCFDACKQAVDDFRRTHDVQEPIEKIDWTGVFWRKSLTVA